MVQNTLDLGGRAPPRRRLGKVNTDTPPGTAAPSKDSSAPGAVQQLRTRPAHQGAVWPMALGTVAALSYSCNPCG